MGEIEVEAVAEGREILAKRVDLVDHEGVDPDLAEELVRRNTGQIREDEHILPLD